MPFLAAHLTHRVANCSATASAYECRLDNILHILILLGAGLTILLLVVLTLAIHNFRRNRSSPPSRKFSSHRP